MNRKQKINLCTMVTSPAVFANVPRFLRFVLQRVISVNGTSGYLLSIDSARLSEKRNGVGARPADTVTRL